MSGKMLVHDLRLEGRTPSNLAQNNYEVNDKVAIQHAVDWIGTYATSQGGLSNLYVLCHGYEADWNLHDETCTGTGVGGFGLQLCDDGLSLSNVSMTSAWKGNIDTITIFACATADTGPGNEGTVADGKRFCGEMALHTGATIIAATQTQWYSNAQTFWDWIRGQSGEIDFGNWEGPVYSFSPDDGSATQINPAPQNG